MGVKHDDEELEQNDHQSVKPPGLFTMGWNECMRPKHHISIVLCRDLYGCDASVSYCHLVVNLKTRHVHQISLVDAIILFV